MTKEKSSSGYLFTDTAFLFAGGLCVLQCEILIWRFGGFHVTQVSLIITQVKNKIANHSINWVKKLKYRRRVINKQRAKVSRVFDIPTSSYSAKGITENYRV